MKKIFLFLFLFCMSLPLFAEGNELTPWCCDSVKITTIKTDSCCIKVIVYNPYCLNLKVEFSEYNISTSDFERKYYPFVAAGNSVEYTFCKIENQSNISYRIRLTHDAGYNPACGMNFEFTEGYTQFTGTVDVSDCCPCPVSKDSWVDMYVYKDRTCPNNGCRVLFGDLKIPEGINCYTGYSIEQVGNSQTPVLDILTNPLKGTSFCINATTPSNFRIYLFKNGSTNFDSACVIDKLAGCLNGFDPEDTSEVRCTIDCFNTPWQKYTRTYIINGSCLLKVTFAARTACPPANYQDLQILKIETIGCFNLSQKEVYSLAVNAIIKANPMGFHPTLNEIGCFDTWRISNASCWRMNFYIDEQQKEKLVLEPCDTTECCLAQYRVCRDSTQNITIEQIGTRTEPQNSYCLYPEKDIILLPYPPMYDMNCYAACDWLDLTHIDPKIQINAIEEYQNNLISLNKVIKDCNEKYNCNLNLEIFDILGNKIKSLHISNGQIQNEKDLYRLFEINNGIYLIKLYANNEIIFVNKVIINK